MNMIGFIKDAKLRYAFTYFHQGSQNPSNW